MAGWCRVEDNAREVRILWTLHKLHYLHMRTPARVLWGPHTVHCPSATMPCKCLDRCYEGIMADLADGHCLIHPRRQCIQQLTEPQILQLIPNCT